MALDLFRKAKPVRDPKDEPTRHVLAGWYAGKRPSATYSETINGEAALKHFVAGRCMNKIASAVQTVEWYVEPIKGEGKNGTEKKKLEDVLASPNDQMTGGQLRFWMALSWVAFGRVPFKVGVGTSGVANGIYPLRAGMFRSKINTVGQLTGYEYGNAQKPSQLLTRRDAEVRGKREAYAAQIVKPNLIASTIEGQNNSPLAAIGLPCHITQKLLERAADTADGHPNTKYIVSTEQTLSKDQFNEVRDDIEGREPDGDGSGNVLILDGVKVNVEKLDNGLEDIHSKMPMDDMARVIGSNFGVPLPLLGITSQDAGKYGNAINEARRSFYEDTIIPEYLIPMQEGLTEAIAPKGYRIKFDLDSIDALAEGRVAKAKDLESISFLTEDEKRELCGFGPRGAE